MAYPFDHDRVGTPIQRKDPRSPDTTSLAFDVMAERWFPIDVVLGGTEAMRAAGQIVLPAHDAEGPVNYENRRKASVLFNVTETTLDSLAGKPFVEPIKRMEDIPPAVEALFEDVDLLGSNLDSFCQEWFKKALAKGFCHVLVDFPITTSTGAIARTLADDRAEQIRPYWILIPPENVIFAEMQVVNGKETLVHVRIRERSVKRVGFAETVEDYIRILEPGHVTIYKLVKKDPNQPNEKDEWMKADEYDTSIPYIPMVTYYTHRQGFMMAKPPLMDLAHMNILHFQSSSDQRNILTVTRFPMLACSGVDDEEGLVKVGPNQVLMTTDNQAKFYYVEHTGAAIEAGQNDIKRLEEQMASYGAEFLKVQPDRQTATARQLDSAEALSPLGRMVVRFQDAVSTAMTYTANWLGDYDSPPGHIEIDTAFNLDEVTQWEMQTLQATRQMRDISRKAYLNELKRRRVLAQDYDIDQDEEALQEEMASGLVGAGLDLNPGAPEPTPENPGGSPGNHPYPGNPANPKQVPSK